MEHIYLKGFHHAWHSEKVDLTAYFKSYSITFTNILKTNKPSFKQIFNAILPRSGALTNKDLVQLKKITSISEIRKGNSKENRSKQPRKLLKPSVVSKKQNVRMMPLKKGTRLSDQTLKYTKCFSIKKKLLVEEINTFHNNSLKNYSHFGNDMTSTSVKLQAQHEAEEPVESSQTIVSLTNSTNIGKQITEPLLEADYNKHFDNEFETPSDEPFMDVFDIPRLLDSSKTIKYKNSTLTCRRELLLSHESNARKRKNLKNGNNFIVSFRIHEQFGHNEESKTENYLQEILLLDYQTLDCLRDKIICQSDFQDIQGDVSEDPNLPITQMSRDIYKSAMFYFDNTFYIDKRHKDYEDYSSTIRNWARTHGIQVGQTYDMSLKRVGTLRVRFGYPYLYVHQGCCEHLVIINDARLLTGKDSLCSFDYPLLSSIPCNKSDCCIICLTSPACWIVVQNIRLLYDVTYMCKACFKMFNYIDGKKCGNFKAYHYFQKSALL